MSGMAPASGFGHRNLYAAAGANEDPHLRHNGPRMYFVPHVIAPRQKICPVYRTGAVVCLRRLKLFTEVSIPSSRRLSSKIANFGLHLANLPKKGAMHVSFYDRFDELCRRDGKARSPVCEDLGLSRTAWTKWKKGSTPDMETVLKIADYFQTGIGYLLEDPDLGDMGIELIDDETRQIRDIMRNRPGIRLLFDTVKDVPDSDLYQTLALAMKLKEQSENR